MKDLLEHFPFKKVGTYATVIGIFIYNVLSERDVACTCKDQANECWIYIVLPVVVIFFLSLWIEKTFQRVFRYHCICQCMSPTECCDKGKKCCDKVKKCYDKVKKCYDKVKKCNDKVKKCYDKVKKCYDKVKKCYDKVKKCYDKVKKCNDKVEKYDCKYLKELVLSLLSVFSGFTKLCSKIPKYMCIIVHYILRNILLSLLWFIVVLIDGDWYVCCMNDGSEKQGQLPCKDNKNITAEEKVIIDELKNRSKIFGFIGLAGFLFIALCLSSIDCGKCCERKSTRFDKETLNLKIILEEEENVLKEILREEAIKKLTKEAKRQMNEQTLQHFNVAEVLINAEQEKMLNGQMEQQQLLANNKATQTVLHVSAASSDPISDPVFPDMENVALLETETP